MHRQEIRTKRLLLRPLSVADAKRIAELGGEWEVCSKTSRMPYPYTPEMALQWVSGDSNDEFIRGITLNGELIGVCGFMPAGEAAAEIGYWIGKPFWAQGYGTEAARAIVDECFKRAGYDMLHAGHFADNPASARIIEKLGFAHVGNKAYWCEARRGYAPAMRYTLAKPKSWWREVIPDAWWRPATRAS